MWLTVWSQYETPGWRYELYYTAVTWPGIVALVIMLMLLRMLLICQCQ